MVEPSLQVTCVAGRLGKYLCLTHYLRTPFIALESKVRMGRTFGPTSDCSTLMAWTMLAADIESTISPAKMLTGRSYHGRVPVYYSSIGTDNLGRLCRTLVRSPCRFVPILPNMAFSWDVTVVLAAPRSRAASADVLPRPRTVDGISRSLAVSPRTNMALG
jgi:hypothetical protein